MKLKYGSENFQSSSDQGTDISIVIPFFNGEKFLPRLVKSLCESYEASDGVFKVQLVVIIDSTGSDISQVETLLEHLTAGCGNISHVIQKNETNFGVAGSRTIGKSRSSGKYITYIDQDDYVDVSYFSTLEKNLTGEFDFFVLNGYVEFEKQKIRRPVFYYHNRLTFSKIVRSNFLITPGLLVFNKDRITCEFRQVSMKHPGSDDWAFYLELLSDRKLKYKFIRETLIHYVVHDENFHHDKFNFIVSQIRTIQYFKRKHPRNLVVKMKLSSLHFRLKLNLSMISVSTLTLADISGFFSLLFIELFSINNITWLLWRKHAG